MAAENRLERARQIRSRKHETVEGLKPRQDRLDIGLGGGADSSGRPAVAETASERRRLVNGSSSLTETISPRLAELSTPERFAPARLKPSQVTCAPARRNPSTTARSARLLAEPVVSGRNAVT